MSEVSSVLVGQVWSLALKINQEIVCHDIVQKQDSRTRGAKNIFKQLKASKQEFKNSIVVHMVPTWNKLPTEVKSAKTVNSFKTGLKNLD